MKKIIFLLFISGLLILSGCDNGGVSVPDETTVDAATEEDMTTATGEILDVAGDALAAARASLGSTGSGVEARTVHKETIPETVVDTGVKVSGSYSYDDSAGDFEYNLKIGFTNYTDGTTTLNGNITYSYEGSIGDEDIIFSATVKGDVDATIDGVVYNLSFSIKTTYNSQTGIITVNGWVKSDEGYVIYDDVVGI